MVKGVREREVHELMYVRTIREDDFPRLDRELPSTIL